MNQTRDQLQADPGGTSLHFVTFPPTSVFSDPSFDGEAARDEALIRLRGLADHFEKEDPVMHKTNTVDYAVVYDGEIWLELDVGMARAVLDDNVAGLQMEGLAIVRPCLRNLSTNRGR